MYDVSKRYTDWQRTQQFFIRSTQTQVRTGFAVSVCTFAVREFHKWNIKYKAVTAESAVRIWTIAILFTFCKPHRMPRIVVDYCKFSFQIFRYGDKDFAHREVNMNIDLKSRWYLIGNFMHLLLGFLLPDGVLVVLWISRNFN